MLTKTRGKLKLYMFQRSNVANQPPDTAECSTAKRRSIGSAGFALILIEPSPQLHPIWVN